MGLITSKTTNYDMKEFPTEAKIPTMYFRRCDDIFVNTKMYIPAELQPQLPKKSGMGISILPEKTVRKQKGRTPVSTTTGSNDNDVKVFLLIDSWLFSLSVNEYCCSTLST